MSHAEHGGDAASGDHPRRGGIYTYRGLRDLDVLVVSIDQLNAGGTAVVCDVAEVPPVADVRALLAVPLADGRDPSPGRWVLAWRLNLLSAARLDVSGGHQLVSAETMDRVVEAIKSAIIPL